MARLRPGNQEVEEDVATEAKCWTMRVLCVLLIGISTAVFGQSAPQGGVDVLWAYAGEWKTQTEHFDTAYSKAGSESATLRNECWKNGGYVVCNQYVNGESKALLVFTWDAKSNAYDSYPIPAGGGEPGHGTLTIEGNVWTFPWQMTDAGVTTYFRVVNVFASPDRIEYRQEFSKDKVHWIVMARGTEARISGH